MPTTLASSLRAALKAPRISRATTLPALVTVALLLATFSITNTPTQAQSSLPPLPQGWPSSTLQLGMGDGPGGAANMRATAPFGFRYQYLSGGVNTGSGWATWNPNGQFVTYYVQDSQQNGITPVFTYYQMRQSAPNQGLGDGDADFNNMQNQGTMSAYFNDLKLFYQRAGAFPQTKIVLHLEPDLWGFLEQRSTNDDATTVPVQVSSTGMPELAGLPNNVAGFAQAAAHLRDLYAPNVIVGYHLSVWGTGNDILYSKPDNTTVTNLATRAGNFYLSLHAPFDISFAEFSDRDAAFKQYQYGDGGASWWGAADYQRNELFISRFVSVSQKRIVFWQIPVGNTRMQAMNNTWDHYQDNHVEWLLDDPTRANLNAYVQAGVVAYLFGRGADGATCFCDAAGDGVTNPPPINGNTRPSLSADDDGGFFRDRAANYYSVGAMPLSGGGGGGPTSTPTATATRTSTPPAATFTATPTATAGAGTQTVTFDDLSSPNRVLSGQYPSGVIDWGTNAWWLSGPYGQFHTNSVSFNGGGPTSATFTLLNNHQLARIDAFNGGSVASTITLSCTGQPNVSVSLAAGQMQTISTNWSGTCGAISVGSSNGWDTNFDNLVLNSSASISSTNTPVPTATPTRTPTPGGSSQTLTFDDLSSPNRVLNGQYPSGVADWGSNAWYLSGPYGRFSTNSVSFNGASLTSASVTFLAPRHVVRVDAYNGGSGSSTVTISCPGSPSVSVSLAAGQLQTITTGWSGTCTSLTVASSNGWWTNFDNLVIQ